MIGRMTEWGTEWEIALHSDADLAVACGQKKPGKSSFSLGRSCGTEVEVNHCNYFREFGWSW